MNSRRIHIRVWYFCHYSCCLIHIFENNLSIKYLPFEFIILLRLGFLFVFPTEKKGANNKCSPTFSSILLTFPKKN